MDPNQSTAKRTKEDNVHKKKGYWRNAKRINLLLKSLRNDFSTFFFFGSTLIIRLIYTLLINY